MARKVEELSTNDCENDDFELGEIKYYSMPGRPPKNPKNLIRLPVRCLTTQGVRNSLTSGIKTHGITLSNYLRLALYNQLRHDGLMTVDLMKDATWDELKTAGLV